MKFVHGIPMKLLIGLLLVGILYGGDGRCSTGCDVALGSYYLWRGSNLSFISRTMQVSVSVILSYNPQIINEYSLEADTRINIPFACNCLGGGEYLGQVFIFWTFPGNGSSYSTIARSYYANLTTEERLQSSNPYPAYDIPTTGVTVAVPVNCSCGDMNVSSDYGLFITYPLQPGETLEMAAQANNVSADLVRRYNPTEEQSSGNSVLFIPARDLNGSFVPLQSSNNGGSELPTGAIAGICAGAIVAVLLVAGSLYVCWKRRRSVQKNKLLSSVHEAPGAGRIEAQDSTGVQDGASPFLTGITVDKSVEFSYDELAQATNDFSIAKIGEGGFGAVYYAELRGEKAAIKKMDIKAGREFLAELKVLTRVHHPNLVRLIGYCVEGFLFLVYEFIENGNLSQHLRGKEPLPWSTRVQIALDSARGLEYIHELTVPVYIHRDIKPANILIDKSYHAKVAGFGLTKLTEVGSYSLQTGRLVGTFGYMPPEYVQYGDVSPKVDVYAFGVVLYELISAKEAIVKGANSAVDSKGLVALFEEALSQPDPSEGLTKLVDPRLCNNYPLDQVQKIAQLARVCTHETPQLRPSMRSIVVALMTLSSTNEDWDVGTSNGNHGFLNLMSGR